jgi:hypothetical protein
MRGVGASHHGGTRFRLFPQAPFLHPERPPEIVRISVPPGLVGPGPGDDRLFVVDPIGKHHGYGLMTGPLGTPHLNLPPWRGPIRWPAQPDAHGHFDCIPVVSPTFALTHAFGTLCFVLDVWERYFGRRIHWHFARHFPRLEVSMRPSLDNARVGYGFMEIGTHPNDDGTLVPYALNFDVLAHELGHLIIYGTLGLPDPAVVAGEFFGFQEAAADMTALVTALHFDSMIDQLLEDTRGNLYALNELNRFAELSTSTQIPVIQSVFDTVYRRNDLAIRAALMEARDYLGLVLAETWKRLSLDFIRYEDIARTLLGVDRDLSGGRYWPEMIESFTWREIGSVAVGPRIAPPAEGSHASPARTLVPELGRGLPRMSYRERLLLAKGA